jgi:glutathione reductase (NADPH)
VLRGFDEECRTFVHEALKADGIKMRTETEIERIERRQESGGQGAVQAATRMAACSRPTS